MTQVTIEVVGKPSSSKGWARYGATADGARLMTSRTGNHWLSASHGADAADGAAVELTTQVMLRVGPRKREEIDTQTHRLVVETGAECSIEHRPGSQGLTLRIVGARLVEVAS